ncbi:MAG TPA: ATP-binding cassette domain-containing protein [Pirellulales bacterium]|jgi:ABC-type multidrug transport system ATPase subunit|nr:ATP-binding cassette domain-containing protein [Pirellulales bacterium]
MAKRLLAEVRQVTKQFRGHSTPAIDQLSLSIAAGEVTGLVGPDGAGKTTLIRLLAGLMLPTAGQVIVCGDDTQTGTHHLRHVVSYMPQRFGLYEDLTVAENLRLYADLRGVVGPERDLAFRRLLTFTALAPFTGRLAGKLSGGMKQKLGLACALIHTPRLLLLDEPSVGVDPISRRELWRMVYDLVDEGIGVVWSTAYLDEAERCATVLLLNQGQQLYFGQPKELTARTAGRSFLLENLGHGRRRVLARVIKRPEVVDAVIQGASVRLVIASDSAVPDATVLGAPHGVVVETAPRFEDAFVDLLGGGPKHESPLGQAPYESLVEGAAVVEAVGLTKQFGTFTAAKDISFRIPRGEIYGLLGPNGAGKSTTFKMMCGLLRPTAGSARVAGFDLYRAGGAARRRLGYMAQKFSLYGDLSVRQNLDFFAGVYGLSRSRRRQAITRVIETFGLAPYLEQNSADIPLGFKQRLALASAVMHNPAVLFLDEPTSGVDPLTRREFWLHINAMVEHGVTVMVTTHFLDEAEYCDRIGLVYHGHMIAQGSPDELKDAARSEHRPDPTLEDAFIDLVEHYDRQAQ